MVNNAVAATDPAGRVPPEIGLVRVLVRFSTAMALIAGASIPLLALYIVVDVVRRQFLGSSSLASDEIGGYALALCGMWGLAYALAAGAHVQVDLVLPYLPRPVRDLLGYGAFVLLAYFAGALTYYLFGIAADSYEFRSTSVGLLRAPLWIPQAIAVFGVGILALSAVLSVAAGALASLRQGKLLPVESVFSLSSAPPKAPANRET